MKYHKAIKTVVVSLCIGCAIISCGTKNEPLSSNSHIDTTITYTANIAPLISAHCGSCHISITSGGVNFSTYDSVVAHIDRIIARTSAGTMPLTGTHLTTGQIDTLKTWQASGEKQ